MDSNDGLDYHCATDSRDSNGYRWTHVRFTAADPDLKSSYGWIRNDKLTNGGSSESCLNQPTFP
ncbi:hypothetical protein DMB38_07760 [Streptomyces sp. WAC 06738]|nr:hypothetical protein DMB38_07760 [Streptomyces sp. WAC 06738]